MCFARLIFTPFTDVLSLLRGDPMYLNWSTSSSISPFIHVGRWSWLDDVDEIFSFLGADFYAVTSSNCLQSFRELLEFFFAASKQVDVVSESEVAKQSFSDGG